MAKPFFFSYAHIDWDEHLERFFTKVKKRVRQLLPTFEEGYIDLNLRPGEQWSREIVDVLRATPALVCVYSPSFFNSAVCASEMQLFLERRLKYIRANAGKRPTNVIPILWLPTAIPHSVPDDFQYQTAVSAEFKDQGVFPLFAFGPDKEQEQVAYQVALRIKVAAATPLPDLGFEPALGGIESAFEPPPLPPADFDRAPAGSGPEVVTYVYANAPPWDEWPFRPDLHPLLHISAAVAKGRDLVTRQIAFDPAQGPLLPRLEGVRNRNNLLVMLLDGRSLDNAALRERFFEFDAGNFDPASTLVVWPAGARTAAAQQMVEQTFPNLSRRQPPAFFPAIDDPEKFAKAVKASLDALKNAVLRNPYNVPPLPPTSGFATVPSVSGPGERRAA